MLEAHRRGWTKQTLRLRIPDRPSAVGRELSDAELKKLLRHADRELRFHIEIAYLMGLRLTELFGLRWDQFDWVRRTIRFLPEDTKTGLGREVPVNPDLLARLRSRYLKRQSLFVFPKADDLSKHRPNNNRAWRECKAKAAVKARWHDLRHTSASRMLRRGVKFHVAKKILGMSEAVLLRVYAHLNYSDLSKAARAMSSGRRRKRKHVKRKNPRQKAAPQKKNQARRFLTLALRNRQA